METAFAVALVSASASLIVCLINNYVSLKKSKDEQREHDKELQKEFERHAQEIQAMHSQALAIMEVKMDALTTSVQKHNNVIERVYALERDKDVFSEQIKVANHRIQDLEDAVKEVS